MQCDRKASESEDPENCRVAGGALEPIVDTAKRRVDACNLEKEADGHAQCGREHDDQRADTPAIRRQVDVCEDERQG